MDFKLTIPIGKAIAYVYDFRTYKKKWNVLIDFSDIEHRDGCYYFSILLSNNTSYDIKINGIKSTNGELFLGRRDWGECKARPDIVYDNKNLELDIHLKAENSKKFASQASSEYVRVKYMNTKPEINIIVEYEVLNIQKPIQNIRRVMKFRKF